MKKTKMVCALICGVLMLCALLGEAISYGPYMRLRDNVIPLSEQEISYIRSVAKSVCGASPGDILRNRYEGGSEEVLDVYVTGVTCRATVSQKGHTRVLKVMRPHEFLEERELQLQQTHLLSEGTVVGKEDVLFQRLERELRGIPSDPMTSFP